MRRAVLLDTSVLIHDPESINAFPSEVAVLIPIYVVMELDVLKDSHKSEKTHVAALARRASNLILSRLEDKSCNLEIVSHEEELDIGALDQASNIRYIDLLILKTAIRENHHSQLTLISKDINLRILAESSGIETEDYRGEVREINQVYRGMRDIYPNPDMEVDLAQSYWAGAVRLPDDFNDELTENEYLRMETSDGKTHLFQHREGYIAPVGKVRTERAKPRNLEQLAALDLLLDSDVELVALLGKAGTGKTFLALAAALEQSATYTRILLSKPVVDVGRGIGFLPGSLQEKLEPWMQSFFDNLDQISPMWDAEKNGHGGASSFLEDNYIEIQPIHSIRGRSLKQAFMIIDEAQNLTKHEIKSIITRAAEGTKVVLLGDPFQIDHPYLDEKSNGLVYVIEKMKGEPLFGAINLHRSERSKLSDIAADKL